MPEVVIIYHFLIDGAAIPVIGVVSPLFVFNVFNGILIDL